MCIQLVMVYSVCGCVYHKHPVDTCPYSKRQGHDVKSREILTGYTCPNHSSSAVYRESGARPRGQAREEPSARPHRQAREEYQYDTPLGGHISEFPDSTQYRKLSGLDYDKHGRPVRVKPRSKKKDSDNRTVISSSSRRHRDSSTSSSCTALLEEIIPQPALEPTSSTIGLDQLPKLPELDPNLPSSCSSPILRSISDVSSTTPVTSPTLTKPPIHLQAYLESDDDSPSTFSDCQTTPRPEKTKEQCELVDDGPKALIQPPISDSVCWADLGYPIYPVDTGRDISNEVPSWRPPPIDDVPYPGVLDYSESEVQTPSTRTAPPREIGTSRTPSPGETTCPHHLLQNVASCPRECGWNVEQTIERGDAATDISRRQLHDLLTDSLMIAFANLSGIVGPAAVTQSSDPCRSNNSHKITDTIQLDTLQSDTNPESSTSSIPQLPTTNSDNSNEAECRSTTICRTRKTKKRKPIPPCYLLIFLGVLTVIGSLLPGLWRAISRNDLSGGFTLAQYILGVGIFVVGSMVAIHSKTCECWKTHKLVD